MSVADVPPTIPFAVPGQVCRDFERASQLEWLETNHTGAYAMGTVAGVNTRRYHALLIASLHPPADRYSILPRVEESVWSEGARFELATVQYPGAVQPRGFELLDGFAVDPFPRWSYRCGSTTIHKIICLLDGQQSVLVKYETTAGCHLEVRFFIAFRDYHSLARECKVFRTDVLEAPASFSIAPYADLPRLFVLHRGVFRPDASWYRNHEYLRELDRGLDFREDLFSPGFVEFQLEPQRPAWFIGTLEPEMRDLEISQASIESILAAETERRRLPTLARALDQFRVTRSDKRPSLIAGYPWFTDWSRDILISLPALRTTSFPDREIKEILEMLLSERSQGLLPNRFTDRHSAPEYNTADASLWLFVAAYDFIEKSQDLSFLREVLYPAALEIIEWHRRGTRNEIHVDAADGLLWAGNRETQLTWMDARVDTTPVTPRYGKPVEINALWYNALRIASHWSEMLSNSAVQADLEAQAERVLESFRKKFWNSERQCLFDVIRDDYADASVRPNQLFAISLPFPLLDLQAARLMVDLVGRVLLTPFGLRTLESGDPSYRPRFEGSMEQRDASYHQGTVWPWLIGPFVDAYLYAYEYSDEAVRFCRGILRSLEGELSACCLGALSEVYDADPPHRPGGCPAQLWSVAQFTLACYRLGCLARH